LASLAEGKHVFLYWINENDMKMQDKSNQKGP